MTLQVLQLLYHCFLVVAIPRPYLDGIWIFEFYLIYLFVYIVWPPLRACGISVLWPGIEPAPLSLALWSLNPWTAKEVLGFYFFYYCKFSLFCRSKAIKMILFLVTSFVFFLIGIFPFHLKLIYIKLHIISFHNIFQEYSFCRSVSFFISGIGYLCLFSFLINLANVLSVLFVFERPNFGFVYILNKA